MIDYDNSLTNLACSILKYFGLSYKHKTLTKLDNYLSKNPKNVVVILCDGLGYNILNRTLSTNEFLVKNIKDKITSVYPPTTAAATTSVMTGLNPSEHCWLGWDNYIKSVDEVVTMYFGKIKDTDKVIDKDLCHKIMGYETIMDKINKNTNYNASYISNFAGNTYETLDEMSNLIKENINKKDKNYLYVYYKNPDELMHIYGTDDEIVKNNILDINNTIEKLSKELKDTLIVVIADHGHINSGFIYLEDYKDIFNMLKHTTSIDSRASMFFVKDEYKDEFPSVFNKYFSNKFILMSKEEIIKNNLFGDGEYHKEYLNSLGDFIALANSDLNIKYKRIEGKKVFLSSHAGITEDEVYIPLIIYET